MTYPIKEFDKTLFVRKSEHIISYGHYDLYDDGRVWSNNPFQNYQYGNQFLKGNINRSGYLTLHITVKKGYGQIVLAHRLIATAFIPNPLNLPQINHKNGVKTDNRIENLEWCSPKQNVIHAYEVLHRWNDTGIYCIFDNKKYSAVEIAWKVINPRTEINYNTIKKLIRDGRMIILTNKNTLWDFQEQWKQEKHLWIKFDCGWRIKKGVNRSLIKTSKPHKKGGNQ